MNRKSIDLFIVIVLTLIAIGVAFVLPMDNVLGRSITLPLILLLPGYALTALLFSRQGLGIAERLLLSLGVSLVLTILSGLLLNLIPYGLQTRSWALVLGGIMLVTSLAALIRRESNGTTHTPYRLVGLNLPSGILLGIAALIVAGAIMLSNSGAESHRSSGGPAQLWLLPGTNTNQPYNVRLGVSNRQQVDTQYDLTISVDGTTIHHWSALHLKPDEQ